MEFTQLKSAYDNYDIQATYKHCKQVLGMCKQVLGIVEYHGGISNARSYILSLPESFDCWKNVFNDPRSSGILITYLYENYGKQYSDYSKGRIAFELDTRAAFTWFKQNSNKNSHEYHKLSKMLLEKVSYNKLLDVRRLLQMGISPNIEIEGLETLWQRTSYSPTMHMAIQYNNFDMVKLLLAYGADPNVIDDHGETPLNRVFKIFQNQYRSDQAVGIKNALCIFIQLCLHPNIDFSIRDHNNSTIIDYVKESEYSNLAYLIDNNIRNRENYSILEYLRLCGFLAVADWLED
jgi:hypothetical protein